MSRYGTAIACLAVFAFCGGAPSQQARTLTPQSTAASADQDTFLLARQLNEAAGLEAGSDSAAASTNNEGPAGIVPRSKGFNASLGSTSQHDSAGGWSSILTPNIAYRFNRFFSANFGVPVYAYVNVVTTTKTGTGAAAKNVSSLATRHLLLGDTTLAGEFETHASLFDYNLNVTAAAPTGDYQHGLGGGQWTYEANNHFEHPLNDTFTPSFELGIGNSPNLTNERVRESYVVVGTNAHFEAGLGISLPFRMEFESDAFEDLPLATQTVTSTTTNGKKGKQLKVITTSTQKSVGEDNGFLNTLDIPLTPHVTLSGFYNRSLRNKIDTAGFSFTFLLRGTHTGGEQAR